ncbi:MAG: long-chain-fatty-acid--CoA ligase [Comamonadaceae bacterium]|nr:MAG: long-chain-fatty-acid--CoA ligase [Comamonadaceae bacterium]
MTDAALASVIAKARQHTIGDLLRRTALRSPAKVAVIDGQVKLSYAEFDEAVNRCAAALADRGLTKGGRLALLSHNCWQFGVLNFACARLGALLVPVNFGLGPSEIAYILDHSGASVVVAEAALGDTVAEAIRLAENCPTLRGWIGHDDPPDGWENVGDWIVHGGESPIDDIAVADDDPIRLMYTSGTEARPKGVLLSSKSLISQYVSCIVDGNMSAEDVEIHALPMFHCAQMDCFFSVDVYLGATSIILPAPDPATILRTIESSRVTKLFAPPTVWISLLRHPDFNTRDLSSLQKGYYGAAAMPVEVLREIGDRLPGISLWNFYGQTELSPVATILPPSEQESRAGSAGRPSLNVETRIVDDEGREVPPGHIGEIVHRSPHTALGYYNDTDKTAEAFSGGWFHSGDLGLFDADGYLTVVDRKKDMIKTGGENVSSREVEESIYLIDGVAEVAVFAVPHPKWIEAVTAVIVPKAGAQLTLADVDHHLATNLAPYKRPKYVLFAPALPKNPSGKILKKELRTTHVDLATLNRTTTEEPVAASTPATQ